VLADLRENGPAAHQRLFERHGDVVRLQVGPFVTHFLFHPDDVKHVLQDAHRLYCKQTYGGRRARALLGDGLFNSEGERWSRQRRLTQAALVSRDHPRVLAITAAALLEAMQRWRAVAVRGQDLDFDEELLAVTFAVIARVLMDGKLSNDEVAELRCPFDSALKEVMGLESLGAPRALEQDPEAEIFRRSLARLHELVLGLIAERRAGLREQDIMTRLIEAGAQERNGFDDEELRDQIKTLLLSGHETTARSASFALLASVAGGTIVERLRDEAQRVLGGPGSLLEKVDQLVYTEAFVQEVLRLEPPVWSIERKALSDDVVRGYSIPAGSSIVLSPIVTHRHPAFWDEPSAFRPERFLEAGCPRHRLAYFPFGGGARSCVGGNVAIIQLKLMLAAIFREFTFELAPGFTPQPAFSLVARFAQGLRLRPLLHSPGAS
jgi:cytochrome P450